ncbi:bifunctional diaminohydroxyphosphoribosylaminopyrimidine deaminase/5-amino-6-(5-phosphoribosylamino)uracil reductase RibD [Sphingobacterium prati]|uniref:bifunctional diaminohydroxyphosphoribosylaminopyrimidine deaminase/5-amino-6-(5-phosphoribosylamino)uracil reductase RibD n=1 Tax=Sphingobacterium prati TaxID=2737006 RepID=UPI0015573783|nr:bifunctional diaminohydroxyphosphoribosylaminopyrimidine deaminase/5-amino-6-(5-phosphoribosylamino)uracil reductase RibD [Sphingobacterium prati]NPE47488.1 bifunctional diaminohydroxyphosphoribosylaminopyrimidine deaminase/5-amino-6-(5-phosphoribosylamino)uracil reductase RibD [Sphingobacterium prati]
MNMHRQYMQRCLDLALLGAGSVSPNPMVGAVIVLDDQIIGEGYTSPYGGPHAEVNAVNSVLNRYGKGAQALLAASTFYVSLEPCAHYGKTPPCANMIADLKPSKVFVACLDPYAKVNGKGIEILRAAGIEVEIGLLEKEAIWLNRRFFTRIGHHRPYVILKWAQSKDGLIGQQDKQVWISNVASQQLTHRWRAEEDAILVGTHTAQLDNPSLTVRHWKGKNPIRVLIDRDLVISPEAKIFDEKADTIVFNAKKTDWQGRIKHIELENYGLYLPQSILYQLYLMDVQSIIIEGGAKTLQTFIDAGLWDEARVFQSEKELHRGVSAPKLNGRILEKRMISSDLLTVYVK